MTGMADYPEKGGCHTQLYTGCDPAVHDSMEANRCSNAHLGDGFAEEVKDGLTQLLQGEPLDGCPECSLTFLVPCI